MNIFSNEFEKFLGSLVEKTILEKLSHYYPPHSQKISDNPTEEYWTKKQAANQLNVSLSCINNYLKQGKIKKFRIGNRVLIKRKDLSDSVAAIS